MFEDRLTRLKNLLDEKNCSAVIVTKIPNLRYFSGFKGDDSILIITRNEKILVTDFRYIEQAKMQTEFEIRRQDKGIWSKVFEILKSLGLEKKFIAFEGKNLVVDDYSRLMKNLPDAKFESISLDLLRQVKDDSEVALIQKACDIADHAFEQVLDFIRPGVSENEIAARLENFMRIDGSSKPSFQTIVASGKRSSLPHGVASEKLIERGDFVTMDFGATFDGYCSDITRTVVVGKADDRQKEIYNLVLNAQKSVLEKIRPGVSGKIPDAYVRNMFGDFEKYFGHGLGHGVGLEIHEEPRLSKFSRCESLQKNMIVTDEPGIYIENFGGVRIEDTTIIRENSAEPLTHSKKDLIEI